MKTRILITGLALASTIAFAQKKEIKKAEKALKSQKYSEAEDYLNQAEGMLGSADTEMQAQFYAARGEASLGDGNKSHAKLLAAAADLKKAISLDAKIESQISAPLQNMRAALVNGAIKDQNSNNYQQAVEKLYTSYTVSNDVSDLYYAAGNAVNGEDYLKALELYQMLLDANYTGVEKQYVATNKTTGKVEVFDNVNLRDLSVKTGEFLKPEVRNTESRKGEILRNMTLIYIQTGENEKAKTLMQTARAENPDDISLMRADANMSYKMGDLVRYNEIMNQIVASDPDNPDVFFNLGVGSAEIGEKEKALGFYKRAIELDPSYDAALINIAVLMLAEENKLVEEMNKLGSSAADNKKYDALKKQREETYAATLPYLERAYKINPNNPEVVQTMMNIYSQMGEDAKFKQMKEKMETLDIND